MKLDSNTINALADRLEGCQLEQKDTTKITDDHPEMDWDDAYAIQDLILASKLRKGARVVGYKAGLTSHAKMKQMGVTDPVFGFLVDEYVVAEGAEVKVSELIHPKVEPEICFITRTELTGPGCHIGAVLGHPAAAVAMLVNHLGRRGQSLPAGSLVLSGGITEAVPVQAGDNVTLRIQNLGSVSVRFV